MVSYNKSSLLIREVGGEKPNHNKKYFSRADTNGGISMKNTIITIITTTIVTAILTTMVILPMVNNANTTETTATTTTTEPNVVQAGGMYGDLKWGWKYGTLTIEGEGAMKSVMQEIIVDCASHYPWFSYHNETTKLVVCEGVTSIGDYAFDMFHNLETVILPDSVKTIGKRAFQYNDALETIQFPNALETIKEGAFAGCHNLTILCPNTVKEIGEDAFAGVHLSNDKDLKQIYNLQYIEDVELEDIQAK